MGQRCAPAASDSFVPTRSAAWSVARQRRRPDAEIVGGEVSFRTSLTSFNRLVGAADYALLYVASAGRRTINTDPLPGSLVTVTSPPIMRASLREMASPSPVPP